MPAPGRPAIPTSITDVEAACLRELARDADVVEFGAAYGYSTVVMAAVARSVVSIDPHTALPGSLETLRRNVAAAGTADRVLVVADVSQAWCSRPHTVDLVFIDGDHSYAATAADLACASAAVRRGGAVAVHDYTRIGSVRAACDDWSGGVPPHLCGTLAVWTVEG